jgi:hypothetical protein
MRYTRAQDSRPAAAATSKQAVKPAYGAAAPKQPEIDPLLKELIDAARQRLKAQTAYYELGRIPLDRLIAASESLERVELLAAKTEGERRAIRLRRANLARDIERREEAELRGGRGTEADTAEARQARIQAQYALKAGEKEDAEKASLLHRISELERKVEQLQKDREVQRRP